MTTSNSGTDFVELIKTLIGTDDTQYAIEILTETLNYYLRALEVDGYIEEDEDPEGEPVYLVRFRVNRRETELHLEFRADPASFDPGFYAGPSRSS